MKKVKIIFNHFVDECKADLKEEVRSWKNDFLTLKKEVRSLKIHSLARKVKTNLLTLKKEARSSWAKNAVRLLGAFLCILMFIYFNSLSNRHHYKYQANYPCQHFKDSHIVIAQVYDYLKEFDPHFNRLNIWYQAGEKKGVAYAQEIVDSASFGKRCKKLTYGEKVNVTSVYHGIFGARYFSTITDGGDGTFTSYNSGHLFNRLPPNVYTYIYQKDMIAILSNDDKKHQIALNTLKGIHKENLTEEEFDRISSREVVEDMVNHAGPGSNEYLTRDEIIREIANEITIEVVDKKSFSSGMISFKATVVRFHVPEFYKKYRTLNALRTGAAKLGDFAPK